jgi:hypothetical protein
MRVELPSRPLRSDIVLLIIALIATGLGVERAPAETPAATTPQVTTLIVFASHRMPEDEWAALFATLRTGAANAAHEYPVLRGGLEILRGDKIEKGLRVEIPIVVSLHGDCTLRPRPLYVQAGRLGWVLRFNGHIEPSIHVECSGLVNMLAPIALAMTVKRRNTVMAEAMTRVILHEWIHIATQSASHAARGVEKPAFGVRDLLADDDEIRPRRARRLDATR